MTGLSVPPLPAGPGEDSPADCRRLVTARRRALWRSAEGTQNASSLRDWPAHARRLRRGTMRRWVGWRWSRRVRLTGFSVSWSGCGRRMPECHGCWGCAVRASAAQSGVATACAERLRRRSPGAQPCSDLPGDGPATAQGCGHLRLVTHADLEEQIAAHIGRRGSRRATTALRMADGAARNPLESAVRARLILANVPPPVLEHPVVFSIAVLQADMAWPEAKVCLGYRAQRTALLTAAGWIVVYASPGGSATIFPRCSARCERRSCAVSRTWPSGGCCEAAAGAGGQA